MASKGVFNTGDGISEAIAMGKFRQSAGFFLDTRIPCCLLFFEARTARWCPSSESRSVGEHNSNFIMAYGRYIYNYLLSFINQLITGGARPCVNVDNSNHDVRTVSRYRKNNVHEEEPIGLFSS